jgi:uncharacterized protein YbjT (DUF2867 family)
MTNTTNNTILVIGSTGKTGKRVADQLEKRDIDVRHGSRSVDAISKLTELAKDAGVSRLVLLSGRNEAEAEKAERVLMASGPEWTIVRCAFFAQNFNEGAWLDEVLAGTVSLPVDHVQEPFVDADDIADVAVAAR